VLGGMLAATSLAIFIVPVLFVLISKIAYSKKQLAFLREHHDELLQRQRMVEEQNIDPMLEMDLILKKEKEQEERKRREEKDRTNE
jgi:HAE1 family hydrophobic/amphiphilic exporter-1